jgi:hypothetical protein
MVNMFASSVIDHEFSGGVMANMFDSSVVDHVFIGGVMVNMLGKHVNHYTTDEHMIYHT